MNKIDFVSLHTHSEYSNIRFLDATTKIEPMIKCVVSLGQNDMALTDHESLSGHVKYIQAVKKMKKKNKIPQDFKPILGNEIYLVDEEEMNADVEQGLSNFYHFLLLAKDAKGHEQLRELSSRAWHRMFTYKGVDRTPTFYSDFEEVVGKDKGHLIASTACLGGYLPKQVEAILTVEEQNVKKYKIKVHKFLEWCVDTFDKENFYVELQPSLMQEQVDFNKYVVRIIEGYKLKHIITTDVHYLREEDREVHKAFLTSDEEEEGNREVDAFYSSTHFFTSEEILKNMDYLEEDFVVQGMLNTVEIANQVEIYDLQNEQEIPTVNIPREDEWYRNATLEDIGRNYSWINKMMVSDVVYDRFLIALVFEGINNKIDPIDYKETFERIDVECKEILEISAIKEQPMSSYFITMDKNINIIWEEANAIVEPGRGSAVGFIIDYLIGITQVNPLKQGVEMPHWRFITSEREDYPDIDIDVPSHKKDIVFQCLQRYYESIGGTVIRVSTFGTESAKSATQTACRGLGINSDTGLYISSLIPVERGFVWDIEDCYYGSEEKERQPIAEFKNQVDEYPGLLEVALGIQGLINKRSTHPCGVLIVNDDFIKKNAIMRSPNGELISQFNLEDSEYVGNIKYDILNTKTCAMIQVTLEMLVEYGFMEWQGTLRKTYDKYLHPDVLDQDTPEMWEKLNKGEVVSAFQFDSPVGEQALRLTKPSSLLEITSANNLMRLMVDKGEQPLEMYVRYKEDISEWYNNMKKFGLSEDEIEIMEKHLLSDYGVCSTQEGLMLFTVDKDIASFTIAESHLARKGVAKKKGEIYEEAHQLFYKKGRELGTSEKLLDYVWDVQIAMQRGYGFSLLHSIAYSYILIQQLNLVYHYPSIFWNTGVLLVKSGSLEQDYIEDKEIDSTERKERTTDYGAVAKAIGDMQQQGVVVDLPDINEADLGFKPDVKNNKIIFGLKGITKINNETAKLIIENRPYSSVKDFYERLTLTKREVTLNTGKVQNRSLVTNSQLIMLIKAGAFDEVERKPRTQVLEEFLHVLYPDKTSFTNANIERVIQLGIVPLDFKKEVRLYRFRSYVMGNRKMQDPETKSIKWYSLCDTEQYMNYCADFFFEHFAYEMEEGKDYAYDEQGLIWIALGTKRKGSFNYIYQQKLKKFNEWLNSEECLKLYNELTFAEIKKQQMTGNQSTWEMESMCFYHSEHELDCVDRERYYVEDFNTLPEEAEVIGFTRYKDRSYPKFKLVRIMGTVLDRTKTRHSVTLLTPTGVVTVKYYAGQFAHYDKQISIIDEEGQKKVVEDGWFKRGTKLLITGFRRGDQFKPKRYKNSIFSHTTQLITGVDEDGILTLQSERTKIDGK